MAIALGLVFGAVMLVVGADALVRGAAAIALRFAVSPVVIGLTIVAVGTSAPEMAVSVGSVATGNDGVGLGNVLGSNIANVLLIAGAAATAGALIVSDRLVRVDIPVLAAVTVAVIVFALDGSVGRLDGVVLVLGLIGYLVWLVVAERQVRVAAALEYAEEVEEIEQEAAHRTMFGNLALVVAGVGALVAGAQWLVAAASDLAARAGVSDVVVGLTVVAVGTSLPELATTVVASVRGERDIAIGNVVGSNLFNLLGALGVGAVVGGDVEVPSAVLAVDVPVLAVVTAVFWAVCRWRGKIDRAVGVGFLSAYAVYLVAMSV